MDDSNQSHQLRLHQLVVYDFQYRSLSRIVRIRTSYMSLYVNSMSGIAGNDYSLNLIICRMIEDHY